MHIMMTNKIIVLIMSLLVLLQCKTSLQPKERINNVLVDSIFNFIPKSNSLISNELVSSNAIINNYNQNLLFFDPYYYVEILYYNDSQAFIKDISMFEAKYPTQYLSQDTSYFIIGSEWELSKEFDSTVLKARYLNKTFNQLLPNFGEIINLSDYYISTKTICHLSEGYKIIIISSGNHTLLKPEAIKLINNWHILPQAIIHGYNRGVAYKIGEQKILYWIITW